MRVVRLSIHAASHRWMACTLLGRAGSGLVVLRWSLESVPTQPTWLRKLPATYHHWNLAVGQAAETIRRESFNPKVQGSVPCASTKMLCKFG
jgi:hypothetical protein